MMKMKTFLIVAIVLSVAWSAALLTVPGLSDTVEQYVLFFLSTNAR